MKKNSKEVPAKTPEALVNELKRARDRYREMLAKASFRWGHSLISGVLGLLLGALFGYQEEGERFTSIVVIVYLGLGAFFGVLAYITGIMYVRLVLKFTLSIQDNLLTKAGIEKLNETLEDDFFTKLVQINFKYIDQYYLQTQSQANKSFTLTCIVSVVAFAIIISGIVLMFLGKTTPAYVTAATGLFGEFIAAVFFYLYNRTITKMGQYHQKLVITQNVSLAMKIAEGLPEVERIEMQKEIIKRITDDVNRHLTQASDGEK